MTAACFICKNCKFVVDSLTNGKPVKLFQQERPSRWCLGTWRTTRAAVLFPSFVKIKPGSQRLHTCHHSMKIWLLS